MNGGNTTPASATTPKSLLRMNGGKLPELSPSDVAK